MSGIGFKPSLVLLHGWGVNSQIWNPVLPQMLLNFNVHVLDLPGYGNDPDYAGDYSLEEVTERLLARAPESAIWVGWSFGGTISLSIAINHPERIEKLSLIASTPRFMQDSNWNWGMQVEPLQKLKASFEDYEQGLKRFLMLQTTDRSVLRNAIELLGRSEKPSATNLQNSLRTLVETDLRKEISRIKIDTQHVIGCSDRIVAPEASRFLYEQMRISPESKQQLCQLPGGHLCFLESQQNWLDDFFAFAGVNLS